MDVIHNPQNTLYTVRSLTEEPTKADTCAHDRRALLHLALKVHVKLPDLT